MRSIDFNRIGKIETCYFLKEKLEENLEELDE